MAGSAATLTSFNLDQVLAQAGKVAGSFKTVSAQLWDQPYIRPAILELCRLHLAQLHRATNEAAVRNPAAQKDGLTEDKIASLQDGRWLKDPAFTPAEKAALNFTEFYYLDPQSISDECAAAVIAAFGESGLVCLVEALGFIDSRIRLAIMYDAIRA